MCVFCGATDDVEHDTAYGVNLCEDEYCQERAWVVLGDQFLARRRRYYVDIFRSCDPSGDRSEARVWAGDSHTAHQWATIVNGHPSYRAGVGFVRAA
jgi:hypothetical protein